MKRTPTTVVHMEIEQVNNILPFTGTQHVVPASDPSATDAGAFVRHLYEMLPKPMAGSILLGTQLDDGAFVPTGYDPAAPFPPGVTHISTALFEPLAGIWSERGSQARQQAWLMLDDIDVKVSRPALRPTFMIETNPMTGSKQAIYVYSSHVDLGWGFGMSKAAATAGRSDRYIEKKPSAWHRLPGSLPEPKRAERDAYAAEHGVPVDYTPARIIDFSGIIYTYADVAEGLGLQPDYIDIDCYSGNHKFDPITGESDPILTFLRSRGNDWVKRGRADRAGFRDVICVNADSHSNTSPWARYLPTSTLNHPVYFCHHGGCKGIGVKDLHKWVAAQGGPSLSESQAYVAKMRPFKVPTCMPDVSGMPDWLTATLPPPKPVATPLQPITLPSVSTTDVEAILMEPQGLIGMLREYADSRAVRHSPTLAAVSALGVVGAMSGRVWVVDIEGNLCPPAVLMLVLGQTGVGKESINRIFAEASLLYGFGFSAGWASEPTVQSAFADHPVQLVCEDEVGRKMTASSDHRYLAQTKMMEVYTRFGGFLPEIKYATKANIPAVSHPLLTGVGMTAPEPFYEALNGGMLRSGELGRKLILQVEGMPRRKREKERKFGEMPPILRDMMQRMSDMFKGNFTTPTMDGKEVRRIAVMKHVLQHPETPSLMFRIKPIDKTVEDAMYAAYVELDARSVGAAKVSALYARAAETVARLAGLYALSDAVADRSSDLFRVRIYMHHFDWANRLVNASIRAITDDVEEHASAGEADAIRQRILRNVQMMIAKRQHCVDVDGSVWVKRSKVKNSVKGGKTYTAYQVNMELNDMVDDGSLEAKNASFTNSNGATHDIPLLRIAEA